MTAPADVVELAREIEGYAEDGLDIGPEYALPLARAVIAMAEERGALAKAFLRHANHLDACNSVLSFGKYRCDCGFDAACAKAGELDRLRRSAEGWK